ncbi:MAG: hypothetical protein FJZ04_00310 [Candidatus Moranbacteria bacterium]|nr:hypothetical protein [Candidatus Moranbacteria bacterium]
MYFKARRIPKLGVGLGGSIKKPHLLRAVQAGQAANILKKLGNARKHLEGVQLVSYRDGILKIKTASAAQRQEIYLRKEETMAELKNKGVTVKEIKVVI